MVEQLRCVVADVGRAGEHADVLVDLGGLGVVVAGADVDITAQLVAIVAHDQRHLAVGLQADHAVHDVHTCAFELAGPLHVVGLVEAGLELDEHGDLHPTLGGPDETADDRAVTTRSVQRHLDRLHHGIVGRLGDELLDARREALVGMVDHHRPVTHHVEDRPVGFRCRSDPTRRDRRPRLVLEIRPVEFEELPQEAQIEWCAMEGDVVHREFEFADEQFEHFRADVVRHLETDRLVEPASPEFHLDGLEEVFGLFFFEGEVGVAADAERGPVLDDHPDEEPVEFRRDQLLDGQISA